MQINRTNYENFFLLYVDGELSASEMQAVERFALENSDLAAELDALLETKLSEEDSISFIDKEILYRTASNVINEINYEEQFLLFLDNELTEQENQQTKAFLAAHPELQPAFDQLQQTKLPEETLSFGDRSVLYQKEESKPVVIAWWRMAVAAALIGLMVMVWNLVPSGKQVDPLVKSAIREAFPTKLNEPKPKVAGTATSNESMANQNIKANQVPFYNNNKTVITELAANSNNASNILPKNDDNSNATEIAIIEQPINTTIANNTVPTNLDNADHANQLGQATAMPDGSNETNNLHQTVYRELDTEDENKSLYLGNLELNRDKLRGFFRKAGNIFKSKIKQEDDRTENANPRTLK